MRPTVIDIERPARVSFEILILSSCVFINTATHKAATAGINKRSIAMPGMCAIYATALFQAQLTPWILSFVVPFSHQTAYSR